MLRALLRVALMTAMQYRESFVVEVLVGMGTAASVVIPLVFVYEHAATVSGWTFHEALLVTAFFLVLEGLVGMLVEPNLGAIVEGIRSGQLDYLLLKPPDAQLVASLQRVSPARGWDVLAGVGVAGYALSHTGAPSAAEGLAAVALLGAGLAAIYGLWVLVVCTSFWFVRVDNLRYLLGAVLDAGRWPVTVYRGWVRRVLTIVIPVAVVTSYPALALLGRLDHALAWQAVAVAAGMLAISRFAWVQALRRYTSASS
ncbi:MAG: ABC transporter permease [Myxococcota bacterium]